MTAVKFKMTPQGWSAVRVGDKVILSRYGYPVASIFMDSAMTWHIRNLRTGKVMGPYDSLKDAALDKFGHDAADVALAAKGEE